MPIADVLMNADIALYPDGKCCPNGKDNQDDNNKCNCGHMWFIPPCPPMPRDYPPCPPYPYPCVPPVEPVPLKKSSIEAQICKLSKKAAAIKKMIDNFTNKNKDAIIKIGEASYNFGSYVVIGKDGEGQKTEEDSAYGKKILEILNEELAAIKSKMQELATQLDQEDETSIISSTEKTVTQG